MEIKYNKQKEGSLPLEGIRVVEYGLFHAGPGGGAILGDLGAEVIKIESGNGDPIRFWTSVAGIDMSGPNGMSLTNEVANRNKRNIGLEIKTEAGREIFERLVKTADVFMTNLRKSTKTKLGIDYETISRINPDIIHASVSGYGKEGPMENIGAFDPLGQACSGLMFVTGSEYPSPMHIGILDQATAITLSHAILTALLVRERQGISQELHVSLYGTALWLQAMNLMMSNSTGVNPCVTSDRFQHSPLRNVFCCGDGKWVMCTHHPDEKYWTTFCNVMGMPELLENSKYTDENNRPRHYQELNAIFDKVFTTRSRDEWMADFMAHNLMFAPIQKIEDVQHDPQALENEYVRSGQYPGLGEINIPGYPAFFSKSRAEIHSSAPQLGEQTDEIMRELGYDEETVKSLKQEGAIK